MSIQQIKSGSIASVASSALIGQVPDANAPSGSVIQLLNVTENQQSQTTTFSAVVGGSTLYGATISSRTYSLAATITITPQSTSSTLFCIATIGWSSMSSGGNMAFGGVITLNDTTSIDNSDYPWYPASAAPVAYKPSTTITGSFSPNSTSAQTIRLRPYVYNESSSAVTGTYKGYVLTVMEIRG